jgi:hypothetical protein
MIRGKASAKALNSHVSCKYTVQFIDLSIVCHSFAETPHGHEFAALWTPVRISANLVPLGQDNFN